MLPDLSQVMRPVHPETYSCLVERKIGHSLSTMASIPIDDWTDLPIQ